jgi:hypothetical protein
VQLQQRLAWPFYLEVAKGNIPGHAGVNKFGRSTNLDDGIDTDIWDGANATDDIDIWVAPTQARVHNIASSSASDDGDPAGVGARTIEIFGLTDWDTAEVSEVITLNGVGNVATTAAYVIIHRMRVKTKGATDVNVGAITATAVTDGTITAQINAGKGQTQMAILGFPSTQTFYMEQMYAYFNRAGGGTRLVDVSLLFNPEPDVELLNFLTKHTLDLESGASGVNHNFIPPKSFQGPGILKIQGNGSAADIDMSGGFDGILVTN